MKDNNKQIIFGFRRLSCKIVFFSSLYIKPPSTVVIENSGIYRWTMSSPAPSSKDPLELESLDADSLFAALTGVEKVSLVPSRPKDHQPLIIHILQAIPELLMQVKPILTQLSGTIEDGNEERRGIEAREGVEQYMSLLDVRHFLLSGQSEVKID